MSTFTAVPTYSSSAKSGAQASPRPLRAAQQRLSFESAPLFFAVCCFAAGVWLAHLRWQQPGLVIGALMVTALVALVAAWRAPRIMIAPVTLAWLLLGMLCLEIEPYPNPQTQLVGMADALRLKIEGEVVRSGPVRDVPSMRDASKPEDAQQVDVRMRSIERVTPDVDEMVPMAGGLRLTIYGANGALAEPLGCGDVVSADVVPHQPQRYLDPGAWDMQAYLLEQGVGVLGSAERAKVMVTRRPVGKATALGCRLRNIQTAASEKLMRFADEQPSRLPAFLRLSHEDAAMLAAMVAGDRTYLSHDVRVGFERTGSFHLLVVSGLHLAIVAGLIFWVTRLLRIPRVWASLITVGVSFLYALLTGFGQPVQRSFWMVTLFLAGRLLFRQRSPLNAIGFAALCLLVWNPRALFDAGFEMTLLSVIAIAGLAAPLAERSFAPYLRATRRLNLLAPDASLPPSIAQFRVSLRLLVETFSRLTGRRVARIFIVGGTHFCLRVAELLLVSLIVEVVMALPMAMYFHRITLLALPVNFLIVPFLGVLLPSALLTFAAVLLLPAVAWVPAALTAVLLHSVVWLVRGFASMRGGDYRIPGPGSLAILCFVAMIAFALWSLRLPRRWAVAGCVALLLAGYVSVRPRVPDHRQGVMEVEAIDVGQGDSLLVITPAGKTLLVDAGGFGGAPNVVHNFDIGEQVVSPALWARGIRQLDAVALTHAHGDHMGGMAAVLRNFRPKEMWVGANPPSAEYDALLREAARLGVVVRPYAAGEHFEFGGAEVAVLAPEREYRPGAQAANDDSLVLHVAYGQTSVLLEGDAETASEMRMLGEQGLSSTLLKVGHHGSATSTSPAFLGAVAPHFAIISAGRHNSYGHPRMGTLEKLGDARVATFRTDTMGATSFYLDGTRVTAGPLAAANWQR
jgi:competence protein ComEC